MVELRLGFDFDAIRSVCPSMPLFLFVVVLATNAHDCQNFELFYDTKKKRDRNQREDKRKDLDKPN